MAEEQVVDRLEKVSGVSKSSSQPWVFEQQRAAPDHEKFDQLMAEHAGQDRQRQPSEASLKGLSLIEEIQEVGGRVDKVHRKSPAQLIEQARDVIDQIGKIKGKLKGSEINLETSTARLLKHKLEHIDDKLKIAVQKAGGDYASLETRQARASLRTPLERFLNILASSEGRMEHVLSKVQDMADNRGSIEIADMLAIQIKMNYVQQELEFFTALLSKALESTKSLFNVQV